MNVSSTQLPHRRNAIAARRPSRFERKASRRCGLFFVPSKTVTATATNVLERKP